MCRLQTVGEGATRETQAKQWRDLANAQVMRRKASRQGFSSLNGGSTGKEAE
jgi:hypothetical protein